MLNKLPTLNPNILIWMPIYNEGRYLDATLNSLAQQTDKEFDLLISNNHSTDNTPAIIEKNAHRFRKLLLWQPPSFLSGLQHMNYMWNKLSELEGYTHSIFAGGHDLFSDNLIETLKSRLKTLPEASIVFTDNYAMSTQGDLIGQHQGENLMTLGLPLNIAIYRILFEMHHNILFTALWNESYRKKTPWLYTCCAIDDLFAAEMLLKGPSVYAPGAQIHLREAPNFKLGARCHVHKHLPQEDWNNGVRDLCKQLMWAIQLTQQAIKKTPFNQEPLRSGYIKDSICNYLLKSIKYSLSGFSDGIEALFQTEFFKKFTDTNQFSCSEFITDVSAQIK